jgi:phosphatidylethanolamine N-methyltransferase
MFFIVSFTGIVWNTYALPVSWTVGNELLLHTVGIVRYLSLLWHTLELTFDL